MSVYVDLVLTWILFLALFPMAYFWLRRAWRIAVRGDHSEVALRRGLPPPDARRYAPYELAISLAAGLVVAAVIAGVVAGRLDYASWTAIAGVTIWCKFFASFILGRHAHGPSLRRGT
jgi:hypothetical protein